MVGKKGNGGCVVKGKERAWRVVIKGRKGDAGLGKGKRRVRRVHRFYPFSYFDPELGAKMNSKTRGY